MAIQEEPFVITPAQPNTRWKVPLAVVCVVLFSSVLGFSQTNEHPGYYTGYYFLPALIVAAIFNAMFSSKGGGEPIGMTAFLGVYASLIIGSLTSAEFRKQETIEGFMHSLDQVEELLDAQSAAAIDGVPIDKTFSANPNATGALAVYQQFMAHLLNQNVTLTNEYLTELEEVGLYTILDPTWLQVGSNFEESKRILKATRQIVEKYKARNVVIINDSLNNIRDMNLSAKEKRAFEQGFKKGVANAMSTHEQIWALEIATIDEFDNILAFLAEEPRPWSVDNGQFMFESHAGLDRFNEHLARIDELALRQTELQTANLDAQREKLKDL